MAKYEYWLSGDGLLLLAAWARDGLTDDIIAKQKIGVSRSTLCVWKSRYKDISDALKKGKEVVDTEVENALLRAALAGEAWAVCFWLKNRRPDRWRDKPAEESQGEPIKIILERKDGNGIDA